MRVEKSCLNLKSVSTENLIDETSKQNISFKTRIKKHALIFAHLGVLVNSNNYYFFFLLIYFEMHLVVKVNIMTTAAIAIKRLLKTS